MIPGIVANVTTAKKPPVAHAQAIKTNVVNPMFAYRKLMELALFVVRIAHTQ
jgi:hypothetical protein